MQKDEVLAEILGKIDTGRSTVGISYVLASRFWVPQMITCTTPGQYTVQSKENLHVCVIDNPSEIATRYMNNETLSNDCLNILRLGIVSMINQVFELIKEYAVDTGQMQILQNAAWYHFVRHLRNAFSHNYKFIGIGANSSQNIVEFSDRSIILNASLNDREVDFDTFPIHCGYELADKMLASFRDAFS